MFKTIVFGATGKTGQYITRELLEQDGKDQVVLAVRNPKKAIKIFPQPLSTRRFEYEDSKTWKGLFDEIQFAYLIAPYKGENASFQFMQLLQQAKESDLKKVIFLSGRTTGDIPGSHLHQMEELVSQSGIKHNIIRAGWFMQNFLHWYKDMVLDEDALFLPAGKGKTAFVDLKDIAESVYRLFHSRKWDNTVLSITSEESLNHFEVAEIFTEELERPIKYVPLPGDEFIHAMSNRDWETKFSEKLVYLYKFVKNGKEKEISGDFRTILGKAPGTFREFVNRYKDVWQK